MLFSVKREVGVPELKMVVEDEVGPNVETARKLDSVPSRPGY